MDDCKNDCSAKVGLSMHLVNNETREIEERPVSVRLPKWMWSILKSRANYCHNGSLNEAFGEIMAMGLQYLGQQIIIDDKVVPADKKNWN